MATDEESLTRTILSRELVMMDPRDALFAKDHERLMKSTQLMPPGPLRMEKHFIDSYFDT